MQQCKGYLEQEVLKVYGGYFASNTFSVKAGGEVRKERGIYSCTMRTYSKFQVGIQVQYDAISVGK
jgi:hypothetical protein